MSRWKTGLTAEHAALYATGLYDEFNSIKQAENAARYLLDPSKIPPPGRPPPPDFNSEERTVIDALKGNIILDSVSEAREISDALQEEIAIAYDSRRSEKMSEITSDLVISYWWVDEQYDYPITHRTTITKTSLAEWFYHRNELEVAKRFDENVVSRIESQTEQPSDEGSLIPRSDGGSEVLESLKNEVSELRDKIASLEEIASANFQNWNSTGANNASPLMKIAQEIWNEHYAGLDENEKHPKKVYLIGLISEKYKLNTNIATSLYIVTKNNYGEV